MTFAGLGYGEPGIWEPTPCKAELLGRVSVINCPQNRRTCRQGIVANDAFFLLTFEVLPLFEDLTKELGQLA